MRNRLIAAALAALTFASASARADQILPPGRISNGNDILFGAIKFGKRVAGKTVLQPDSIEIQGDGSTGNVSATSVKPTDKSTPVFLADAISERLNKGTTDLTAGLYQGLPALIQFGNTDAKHVQYSYRSEVAPSILGTTAIVRNTPGSGIFGPAAADFGLLLSTRKDGWNTATGTATKEGEINSLYTTAFQGKKGDATPILAHGEKRRDNLTSVAADESGGLLGFEVGSHLVNAAGAIYHQVNSYGAFMEGPVGISGGRGYGFHTAAFKGELYAAYGAQTAAGQPGKFQRLTFLDTTGASDGSGIIYQVDNLGRTASGLPAARMSAGFRSGIDAYTLEDTANSVALSVGRTNKITTLVGGLQVGNGASTIYRNISSGSAAIPAGLASLAVSEIATIALPGARNGDSVTVNVTNPEIGFSSYRLIGVVTADDTVKVRIQNLTPSASTSATVNFTLIAERFQ